MGNRSPRPTCLGDNGQDLVTLEHGDRILDISLHYFGCLKASERASFFTRLPRESQKQIVEEARRIQRLRFSFEASTNSEARTIIKGFREGAKDWYLYDRKLDPSETQYSPPEVGSGTVDEDVRASIISFENGRPYNIPGLNNEFPYQTISVAELLAEEPDANPLMRPCEGNKIQHFHLPANNMIWVEVNARHISLKPPLIFKIGSYRSLL